MIDNSEMFRQICINRNFEKEVARVYDKGLIKMAIYLSLGQEHIPVAISSVSKDFMIFGQHRCHSYYLSFGGSPEKLRDELLHRNTGTSRGMGGSQCLNCPEINMYGHSGLIGDQVPMAVGAAMISGKSTLCVFGDAAAEEDYVFSAIGYAATRNVPVLFICEDNNLSILTPVSTRRSWNTVSIAKSFGLYAVDIEDDPWLIYRTVETARWKLPAFINIHTRRQVWHAGTGNDGPPEWNRFEMIKNDLHMLGYGKEMDRIERETKEEMQELWRGV